MGYSGSLISGAPSCSGTIVLGLITKSQCCTKCLNLLANLLLEYQWKELHFHLCALHWGPYALGSPLPSIPWQRVYTVPTVSAPGVFSLGSEVITSPVIAKLTPIYWHSKRIKHQSHRPQALGAALLPCACEAVGSLVFSDCCSWTLCYLLMTTPLINLLIYCLIYRPTW